MTTTYSNKQIVIETIAYKLIGEYDYYSDVMFEILCEAIEQTIQEARFISNRQRNYNAGLSAKRAERF